MQGFECFVFIVAIASGAISGATVGTIAKKIGASNSLADNIAVVVLCITVIAVEISFNHAAIEFLFHFHY